MTLALAAFASEWEAGYGAVVREHLTVDGEYPFNNYPLAFLDFAA